MPKSKRPPIRFSLFSLLWIQLLIVPAFLSPMYYRISERSHAYVVLFAFLVAPSCYAGIFSSIKAIRVHKQRSDKERSVIFAAINSGAFYGVLFCTMALGPIAVLACVDFLSWLSLGFSRQENLQRCAMMCSVACAAIFHYAILGAATGAIIGMGVATRRKRALQTTTKGTMARVGEEL